MDKDFLKGIKFSLGIISVFLLITLAYAGTHYASQLLGGTFNGNYDFQTGSTIDFTNATVLGLNATEISIVHYILKI